LPPKASGADYVEAPKKKHQVSKKTNAAASSTKKKKTKGKRMGSRSTSVVDLLGKALKHRDDHAGMLTKDGKALNLYGKMTVKELKVRNARSQCARWKRGLIVAKAGKQLFLRGLRILAWAGRLASMALMFQQFEAPPIKCCEAATRWDAMKYAAKNNKWTATVAEKCCTGIRALRPGKKRRTKGPACRPHFRNFLEMEQHEQDKEKSKSAGINIDLGSSAVTGFWHRRRRSSSDAESNSQKKPAANSTAAKPELPKESKKVKKKKASLPVVVKPKVDVPKDLSLRRRRRRLMGLVTRKIGGLFSKKIRRAFLKIFPHTFAPSWRKRMKIPRKTRRIICSKG